MSETNEEEEEEEEEEAKKNKRVGTSVAPVCSGSNWYWCGWVLSDRVVAGGGVQLKCRCVGRPNSYYCHHRSSCC